MTATTTDEDYGVIGRFVEEHSGIVLGPDKFYLFSGRLQPVLRDFQLADLGQLASRLHRAAPVALTTAVVDAMTTNETSFFRDVHPFDSLRDVMVPDVMARNASRRTLSIWSAACSTGQELYSISMLLAAEFPELADWNVTLHGTDLSSEVVAKASSGRYTKAELDRGLPLDMRQRFLRSSGSDFEIAPEVKNRCSFSRLNLLGPWPSRGQYDIVFCRYVLIYFDVESRGRIFSRFSEATTLNSYLVLGGAETTVGMALDWRVERLGRTSVYRNSRRP